jgi:hypothetical protein
LDLLRKKVDIRVEFNAVEDNEILQHIEDFENMLQEHVMGDQSRQLDSLSLRGTLLGLKKR